MISSASSAPLSGEWLRVARIIECDWEIVGLPILRNSGDGKHRELIFILKEPEINNGARSGYASLPIITDFDASEARDLCDNVQHGQYEKWQDIKACREVLKMRIFRGL